MKKRSLKEQGKYLCSVALFLALTLGIVFPFPQSFTKAEEGSSQITETSQADFQGGTADNTLELNQSPGDLKLKQDLNTYTETTKEDFEKGDLNFGDLVQGVDISEINGGEIAIGKASFYSDETNPALSNGYYVSAIAYDNSRGILYAAQYGGITVIDTKGNTDSLDDEQIGVYTTSTSPGFTYENVTTLQFDEVSNIIYIASYEQEWPAALTGEVIGIDTKGTKNLSDDEIVARYNKSTTAALRFEGVNSIYIDHSNDLVYILTSYDGTRPEGWTNTTGAHVIDRKGTKNSEDDELLTVYNSHSTPAVQGNTYNKAHYDSESGLLFLAISSAGSLAVIDTKKTKNPSDDTLAFQYTHGTSPIKVSSHGVFSVNYISSTGILYLTTWWEYQPDESGLFVIDTKKTNDSSDDQVLAHYEISEVGEFYDASAPILSSGSIYLNNGTGFYAIETNGTHGKDDDVINKLEQFDGGGQLIFDENNGQLFLNYNTKVGLLRLRNNNYSGIFISQTLPLSSTPAANILWNSTQTNEHGISLQYRTSRIDPAGDPFETDLIANEFQGGGTAQNWNDDDEAWSYTLPFPFPFYGTDHTNIQIGSNGLICLDDAVDCTWYATSIDQNYGAPVIQPLGIDLETEQGGDIFITENPDNVVIRWKAVECCGGSEELNIEAVLYRNGEIKFNYGTFAEQLSYGAIVGTLKGDGVSYSASKRNNTVDFSQIDTSLWKNVVWSDWSTHCTNRYGCEIEDTEGKSYLQYRVNLSTDNSTSSPLVNSVTLASGYQPSGTYTSQILDGEDIAHWGTLETEESTPVGTSIAYQTRSGDTSNHDSTWEDWKTLSGETIQSRDARYLQYRATLSTTDQNQTPVLKSATINYSHTSPYSPTIAIGSKKALVLSTTETATFRNPSLVFTGKLPNLEPGSIVQIYQDGTLLKNAKIKKNHRFRLKTKPKKNQVHTFQFKYLNKNLEEVLVSPVYEILIDYRKPKFTKENPKTIKASPGDTIEWHVTDNDQIKYYVYTFQGKTHRTNQNSFTLPTDLKTGKTWGLTVKAFDRAENKATRKFKVKVR